MTGGAVVASETAAVDEAGWADRIVDSWHGAGWRSAMVRVLDNVPALDETVIGAVPDQQVMYVAGGTADVEVSADGGPWRSAWLRPGSVSLTAPGRATRIRWHPGADPAHRHRTVHLYLPGHLVKDAADLDGFDLRDPHLIRELRSAARAARDGLDDSVGAEIAARVARLLVRHRRSPAVIVHDDPRIRRAVDFLVADLAQPVSLADLAAVAGLSEYHFAHLFRTTMGEAPHRFLTRLRVEAAARLLRTTDDPVWSIAYASGFATPAHFSAMFRSRTGVTPSAYRRAIGRQGEQDPDIEASART